MIKNEYSHEEENLRIVDTGKSVLKIVRDSQGDGLWHVETESGPVPVFLRDKKYTRHSFAFSDIKVYLNGHAERSVIYGKKKKTDDPEI